jgi:hypothetical protein
MYEKTIANEHLIFNITIPSSPTLVLDLLSVSDKAKYDVLLSGQGANFNPNDTQPENKIYRRIPVDGYILSFANDWYVGSSIAGGFETVPVEERYTFPVSFWLQKSFIYAPAPIAATIRIFFS